MEPCISLVAGLFLFLSRKEKMIPNQKLSRPHSALQDEQFSLMNAPSQEDSFHHEEAVKIVMTPLRSAVFCEPFAASTIPNLTGSQRCQRVLHTQNIQGFHVSRHSPYSSAFLLLEFGPLLLVSSH